jgi:hypothetical protein
MNEYSLLVERGLLVTHVMCDIEFSSMACTMSSLDIFTPYEHQKRRGLGPSSIPALSVSRPQQCWQTVLLLFLSDCPARQLEGQRVMGVHVPWHQSPWLYPHHSGIIQGCQIFQKIVKTPCLSHSGRQFAVFVWKRKSRKRTLL